MGSTVLALLLLATHPAAALEVTPWNVNMKKLPKPLQRQAQQVLAAELAAAGWTLQPIAKRHKARARKIERSCGKPSLVCAAQAGEAIAAANILTGEVSGRPGNWTITLLVVDAQVEKIIAEASGPLSKTALTQDMRAVTRQLIEALAAPAVAAAPPPPAPPPEAPPVPPPAPLPEPQLAAMPPLEPPLEPPPAPAASPGPEPQLIAPVEPAPPRVTEIVAAPAAAPPTEAPTRPTAETAVQPARPFAAVGVHLDLLLPSGRTGGASYGANLAPEGSRTATFAAMLEVRYLLPPPVAGLQIALEAGWYRLGAKGSRTNPDDPDFGDVGIEWRLHALPILLGVYYAPSLPLPLVDVAVGAGFAYERVWATTT